MIIDFGMRTIGLCCIVGLLSSAAFAQEHRESNRIGAANMQSARYTVAWKELRFGGVQQKTEGTLSAKMLLERDQFRFDLVGKKGGKVTLILDAKNYVTVTPAKEADGKQETTVAQKVSADSPWIMAYPLLLAHGIVPFPPFDHSGLRRLPKAARHGSASGRTRSSHAARELKRTGVPFSVRVTTASGGKVIERYEIVDNKNGQIVLRIGLQFGNGRSAARLQRYTIVWFSASGKATRRIDAQVKEFEENAPIDLAVLVPPRDRAELRSVLNGVRDLKVKVQATMSLDQLVDSLQAALGEKLQVRVDEEAFSDRFKAHMRAMQFDAAAVSVEDVLFDRLQENGIDFYFDEDGLVIVPKHVAWKHSEFTKYLAKDYGTSVAELRTLLYNAVLPDDWSDVGGPGEMIVDKDAGSVGIVHRQSQQMQLQRVLDELKKEDE